MNRRGHPHAFHRPTDEPLAALLHVLADGQRRSRAVLARQLGQSAVALDENLARLVDAGLSLDDQAKGIRIEAFLPLDANTIKTACRQHRLDTTVHVALLTDSTNSQLLRAAQEGRLGSGLTVLATELQSAGRGRLQRVWHATAGASLAVSYAVLVRLPAAALVGLSLVCGLASRAALLAHGVEAELKWPNDLLALGGKLGGILIEMQHAPDGALAIVIGIGLNICADAQRTHALASRDGMLPAIDLCAAGARAPVDRSQLVADLAFHLTHRLEQFAKEGFAPFMEEWNEAHAFAGEQVSLIENGKVILTGTALGVDAIGRLMLHTKDGIRTVVAGDVSVRQSA